MNIRLNLPALKKLNFLSKNNNMVVIKWIVKSNGSPGQGTQKFSIDEAREICRKYNIMYPKIYHFYNVQ